MFKCLVNYNFTPDKSWIGDDYLIYDRSDDGVDHLKEFDHAKILYSKNIGQVDFDKLCFLIENYGNLPDVFLWGKTNLFKYITPEEYSVVKDNQTFTPLLTQTHQTYSDEKGLVCFYKEGMYYERNPLLYFNGSKVLDYPEFAALLDFPNPDYLPFAPGGNYILTREVVHKHSKELYVKMRDLLPYTRDPLEAHLCERSYYTLWK